MDQITREALAGKPLPLPPEDAPRKSVTLVNLLGLQIMVIPWSFDTHGNPWSGWPLRPKEELTALLPIESHALVRDSRQGAFIGVMHLMGADRVVVRPFRPLVSQTKGITTMSMLEPGDIGAIPSPTPDVPVPNDSHPVLVGVGETPNRNLLVRTQQYRRTADSLSLAPNEKRTISITALHGLQEESSDTATVASSVSTSASAGWGPVSAAVNTSLDTSRTVSHAYTVTESTQRFDEVTYENKSDEVQTFFSWQLFDVVTVYNPESQPIASLVSARPPALFMGPYGPANLLRADEVAPAPPAIEGQ